MKVITVARFGGPEVLSYDDAPSPQLGPDEARVRVELSGVNYGDVVLRSGKAFDVPRPYVPGIEAAGVVEEVGADVHDVAVGMRVAVPLFTTGRLHGGYASEVVFDADRLVPLPDGISYEAAIALQLQGISAWLVFDHASVQGRTVLIHAGAGGSGSLMVQLARARGATRILATASTEEKRDLVRRLGADTVIDYTEATWPERVLADTDGRGVDVIIDSVGGRIRKQSFEALATGGALVLFGYSSEVVEDIGDGIDATTLRGIFFKGQTVTSCLRTHFGEPSFARTIMARLFEQVQRGSLRLLPGATFPLDRAADAHRALVSRAVAGKVFLAPCDGVARR
ncbi:Quinone oxidoreductase [Minicystis rosea]|nr:Quinone oxidoreductase [Minicystis rosea]